MTDKMKQMPMNQPSPISEKRNAAPGPARGLTPSGQSQPMAFQNQMTPPMNVRFNQMAGNMFGRMNSTLARGSNGPLPPFGFGRNEMMLGAGRAMDHSQSNRADYNPSIDSGFDSNIDDMRKTDNSERSIQMQPPQQFPSRIPNDNQHNHASDPMVPIGRPFMRDQPFHLERQQRPNPAIPDRGFNGNSSTNMIPGRIGGPVLDRPFFDGPRHADGGPALARNFNNPNFRIFGDINSSHRMGFDPQTPFRPLNEPNGRIRPDMPQQSRNMAFDINNKARIGVDGFDRLSQPARMPSNNIQGDKNINKQETPEKLNSSQVIQQKPDASRIPVNRQQPDNQFSRSQNIPNLISSSTSAMTSNFITQPQSQQIPQMKINNQISSVQQQQQPNLMANKFPHIQSNRLQMLPNPVGRNATITPMPRNFVPNNPQTNMVPMRGFPPTQQPFRFPVQGMRNMVPQPANLMPINYMNSALNRNMTPMFRGGMVGVPARPFQFPVQSMYGNAAGVYPQANLQNNAVMKQNIQQPQQQQTATSQEVVRKPKEDYIPKKYGQQTQYQTEDGFDYYHNAITNTTQQEKPKEIENMQPEPNQIEYKSKTTGRLAQYDSANNKKTAIRPANLPQDVQKLLGSPPLTASSIDSKTVSTVKPIEHISTSAIKDIKELQQELTPVVNISVADEALKKKTQTPLMSVKQAQKQLANEEKARNGANVKQQQTSINKPSQLENQVQSKTNESQVKQVGKDVSQKAISININPNSSVASKISEETPDSSSSSTSTITTPAIDIRHQEKAKIITEEDAEKAFMELLSEKNARVDQEQSQILPLIIYDERYGAIPTLSKRKKILKNYQENLKISEKQERRRLKKEREEKFREMLVEAGDKINAETRFREIKELLENDERQKNVEKQDCEAQTLDYVDSLRKKQRQATIDSFNEVLRADKSITHHSRFKEVAEKIDQRRKPYDLKEFRSNRFERDFRKSFDTYIDQLVHKRAKQKEREREEARKQHELAKQKREEKERLRKEKEKRRYQDVIHLFDEFAKEKTYIHAKTSQSEAIKLEGFVDDERYRNYLKLREPKKTIENLFEDYCWGLSDLIENDKIELKARLSKANISIKPDDDLEQLMELYYTENETQNSVKDDVEENENEKEQERDKEKKQKLASDMDRINIRLLFKEMIAKAKVRYEEKLEKERNSLKNKKERKRVRNNEDLDVKKRVSSRDEVVSKEINNESEHRHSKKHSSLLKSSSNIGGSVRYSKRHSHSKHDKGLESPVPKELDSEDEEERNGALKRYKCEEKDSDVEMLSEGESSSCISPPKPKNVEARVKKSTSSILHKKDEIEVETSQVKKTSDASSIVSEESIETNVGNIFSTPKISKRVLRSANKSVKPVPKTIDKTLSNKKPKRRLKNSSPSPPPPQPSSPNTSDESLPSSENESSETSSHKKSSTNLRKSKRTREENCEIKRKVSSTKTRSSTKKKSRKSK